MNATRGWLAYFYALLVFLGFIALYLLMDFPQDAQHWSADFMAANFSTRQALQRNDIALVYVTDTTLRDYPYVSPIDRGLLAKLIAAVDAAGAKTIGLDVILDRVTESNKDTMLRDVSRHTRAPLVFGAIDEPANGPRAQSEFFFAKGGGKDPDIGHIYFDQRRAMLVVSDHVVRSIAELSGDGLKLAGRPGVLISFADALAGAAGTENHRQPLIAAWLFPRSPDIAWLLRPKDGNDTFLTLTAEDVLGLGKAKLPVQDLLGGKIVLIGGDFDDRDQHLTPLSASRDDFFTGLFIHAQRLAQLRDGRYVYEFAWPAELPIALCGGLVGYALGRRSGHYHLWLELGSVACLVATGYVAFLLFGAIFPYTVVLICWLAGAAVAHYGRAEGHEAASESMGTPTTK